MNATRVGYYLCVIALVAIVFLAWTAIPDCNQPTVCG